MSAELSTVPNGQLAFRPASRKGVRALIGLYGKSGGGKTHSALLVARGMVGEKGRVGLIDTEAGRGHIFSDVIPGGYEVLDMGEPFSAEHYTEFVRFAETSGIDALVVDSLTHEWEGDFGVLDVHERELERMAGDDWKKREQCSARAWNIAKGPHKKFIHGCLLRLKIPLICCLRAQEKMKMPKVNGKIKVEMSAEPEPIFDPRFIFEMLINGEVFANDEAMGGFFRAKKITHHSLRGCLPVDGEQFGVKHGEAIAQWAADPGSARQAARAPAKASQNPEILRAKILTLLDMPAQEGAQWLYDEGFMDADHESFSELPAERLLQIGKAVKAKLEAA